jgi:hypothetical protein
LFRNNGFQQWEFFDLIVTDYVTGYVNTVPYFVAFMLIQLDSLLERIFFELFVEEKRKAKIVLIDRHRS